MLTLFLVDSVTDAHNRIDHVSQKLDHTIEYCAKLEQELKATLLQVRQKLDRTNTCYVVSQNNSNDDFQIFL